MNNEVLKFGGSVLKKIEDFDRAADIISEKLGESVLPICVVSALNSVTDRIIWAVKAAQNDHEFAYRSFIKSLYEEHAKALPGEVHGQPRLLEQFEKLEHVLDYIRSSGELTDSTYAYAISRGENFSAEILSQHLSVRKIENEFFNGEDILVTDDNCRDAMVDLERTKERIESRISPCLTRGLVPVVAGFAGRSESGSITILGRGGSDDTAVCIAYCLGSSKVTKYVDEDGIMTVDPKFLDEAERSISELGAGNEKLPPPKVIPYLNYVEASELLREERTRVVHYKVLDPLMKGNVHFHIRNMHKPACEGTIIGPELDDNDAVRGPKAISFQRKLKGIRFLPTQSRPPIEVYASVFESLSNAKVDVRYLSTSGYQISLLMPQTDMAPALDALKSLDIAVEVMPLEGLKGTFSLVGSGMHGVHGLFSKITGIIAKHGVNIEQATQPNSENIIRFSVDDRDIPKAVSALYMEFFG